MKKKYFLGIDPGNYKIGIAVVDQNKQLVYKNILKNINILDPLYSIIEEYDIEEVAIGNGGNYKKIMGIVNVIKIARNNQKKRLEIYVVDEKNSSIEARKIFVDKEKNIFKKIISYFQSIFIPLDDYSAFVIICRFLSSKGFVKKQTKSI